MTLNIEAPIKVGDKVWLPIKDSFPFSERYTRYQEYRVIGVKLDYDLETNIIEWYFRVEGKEYLYRYTQSTALNKEQLYESFREEIEALIPEDLRNYLWKNE